MKKATSNMKTSKSRSNIDTSKMSKSALAVTSAGEVLANVAHADGPNDPMSVVERAIMMGGTIFVGIVLDAKQTKFVTGWMDDSTAEVVGWVWGESQGRPRRRARSR